MALTPDDVVTKQFQHVRFKEGFDPDEVDDFLDEIVVEWRKTIEENNELKARLAAYESGEVPPAEAPAAVVEQPAEEAPAEPAQAAEQPAAEQPVSSAASSAASIIERAQRLHDEHVSEGRQMAEQLVEEARAEAGRIVSEAEMRQRELNEKYDRDRSTLESRISELRQFERDYRAQMRSFFESKLKDLDATGSASGETPVSAIGL